MWRNDIKCKYMFRFIEKNLARKGLIRNNVLGDYIHKITALSVRGQWVNTCIHFWHPFKVSHRHLVLIWYSLYYCLGQITKIFIAIINTLRPEKMAANLQTILSMNSTGFTPMICTSMGLLPATWNCGLRIHREWRGRFPHHRFQRKPLVNDPGMHQGTCVTHAPWYMSGSLTRGGRVNVPGIPGPCATHNFTYLVRGPSVHLSLGQTWSESAF